MPYAPDAPYKPAAYTLEDHVKLVSAAGLAHSLIVHPEPYQDDHRYLEYCFAHEPRPGYFKGTCLFDPFREDTPQRLRALIGRWPKRIVAMRIHEVSMTPETGSAIRNRDMKDPRMLACWRALSGMGLGVQMHAIPAQAPAIGALAAKFPDTLVILDHMGRPGQGTAGGISGSSQAGQIAARDFEILQLARVQRRPAAADSPDLRCLRTRPDDLGYGGRESKRSTANNPRASTNCSPSRPPPIATRSAAARRSDCFILERTCFELQSCLLLPCPLSAFQGADSTIFAKLGHSQHGEAFDTGPREKPWPIAGIGVAHFPITTKNPEVQHWFDQGNALLHSFWDYEAERAFRWCLKLEPDNAMAYWGLARAPACCAARAATTVRRR